MGFAGFWAINNQQFIRDKINAAAYTPSSEIKEIVSRSTMTGDGELFFYASQPEIRQANKFNEACGDHEITVSVLGCYDGLNIYIYDVTREELDGIKEVTAAHEMLHAAFDRISNSEKEKISPLLEDVAAQRASIDNGFKERMDYYIQKDASQQLNELHSIIGTEVDNLPAELEKYYSRYFQDRQKVVDLYKKYNQVFDEARKKSERIEAHLKDLNTSIEARSDAYSKQIVQMNYRFEELQRIADEGQVSAGEFYAMRDDYNSRVNTLRAEQQAINDMINQYNQLVEEYNQLGANVKSLQDSMNSNIQEVSGI